MQIILQNYTIQNNILWENFIGKTFILEVFFRSAHGKEKTPVGKELHMLYFNFMEPVLE